MKSTSNDAHHIAGYLLKKSKDEVWQKRYFETNSTFLTYYKSRKMSKLLAALNMASVGEITLVRMLSCTEFSRAAVLCYLRHILSLTGYSCFLFLLSYS